MGARRMRCIRVPVWRAGAGLAGGQATFQILSPSRATTSMLPPSAEAGVAHAAAVTWQRST
jgi:hypothetical protein